MYIAVQVGTFHWMLCHSIGWVHALAQANFLESIFIFIVTYNARASEGHQTIFHFSPDLLEDRKSRNFWRITVYPNLRGKKIINCRPSVEAYCYFELKAQPMFPLKRILASIRWIRQEGLQIKIRLMHA